MKNSNFQAARNNIRRMTALMVLILGATRVAACSDSYRPSDALRLDDKVLNFASSLTSNLGSDVLWVVNDSTRRIYRMSVSRFEIEKDYAVPLCEKTVQSPSAESRSCSGDLGVIAGMDGNLLVAVNTNEFAIIHPDGTADVNPVRLQGEIQRYAYAEVAKFEKDGAPRGFLALSDSFGSLALLQINREGTVEASYVAGAVLPDTDEQMTTATAVADSDVLVVRTTSGKLYKLAMKASIEAQDLSLTQINLPAGMVVESLLPVRGQAGQIVVRQTAKISILDINSSTIVDEAPVDSSLSFVAEYRGAWPHIAYLQNASTNAQRTAIADAPKLLFYVVGPSGKISMHRGVVSAGKPQHSYVNEKGDGLTYVSTAGISGRSQVTRLRLKDSLVLGQADIVMGSRFAVTEQHIVDIKPSVLGAMSRIEIARPENVSNLEWFNLENVKRSAARK